MKHHLNAEVQPCPCCAYRAEIEQVPHDSLDENSGGYYIECKRAGCGITTRLAFASMDDPLPGLVQSWNRRTARPEGLANKGPTPRTDGVLPSQSFIDETRLFDRHYYLPLIDLARQLERELAEAKFRPIGDNHHNAVLCPYCNPLVNGSAAVSPRGEKNHG